MTDSRQPTPQKIDQSKVGTEHEFERDNVSATVSPFALDHDPESPMSITQAPEVGPNGGTQPQS